MIGLGLSRKAVQPLANAEVGMLDIAANALAVLILATMLVITVSAPPAPRGEMPLDQRPELFYPSPLNVAVAPQSAYWIVTSAGVTELDLDAFAARLADGATVAETNQGLATLIIDRRMYRDFNDHRAQLSLDWAAIGQNARTTDDGIVLDMLLVEIETAFTQQGTAPTFIVKSDGTSTFAGLYWALREARVPLRWVSVNDRTPLVLSRRADNFEKRARLWQQ